MDIKCRSVEQNGKEKWTNNLQHIILRKRIGAAKAANLIIRIEEFSKTGVSLIQQTHDVTRAMLNAEITSAVLISICAMG